MRTVTAVFLGLGILALAAAVSVEVQSHSWMVDIFGKQNPYRALNDLINGIFFSEATRRGFEERFGEELGYYMVTYLRDLIAGILVYYIAAGVWHIMIYHVLRERIFKGQEDQIPTAATIWDQICLAQASVFCYAALPVFSSWLVENGYTRAYFYVDEIGGWSNYLAWTVAYFVLVEIGIYWVHRTLHTNKFLYKYVHALHHKYNSAATLSPWASIAFNPLDGIAQASPYVVAMFLVPCHYITHLLMLFFTGIWSTNIHDAVPGNIEPIMGAKYHTVHHTHYHYNFGQIFIYCDKFWGTLKTPEEIRQLRMAKKK